MNKRCKNCGANVPDNAKFCQVCRGSDFVADTSEQQQMNNDKIVSAQSGYYQNQYSQQPPIGQIWQPPVPQNKPKKKAGLIVGIVAAVLVVLAVIGIVSENLIKSKDSGYYDSGIGTINDSENSDSENYTKGEFDGAVYVNEWANIKLSIPEGFSDADSSQYSIVENSTIDCGIYFISDDRTSAIYVCYEKLPSYYTYNENKYLDAAIKALDTVSGITYSAPDAYSEITVAGTSYTKAEYKLNNSYMTLVNTVCVRKLGDRMVSICVMSPTSEKNAELIDGITKVK